MSAAIYEQDLLEGSEGFRPGRRAHDAGRPRKRMGEQGAVRGSCAAAIGSCVDSVERPALEKRLAVRGAEGARLRRIGQGLHGGGLDGAPRGEPALGTAQGSGLSPWLGNVYVQSGLDQGWATAVKPRRQGKATLRRSCDDGLIGFAREDDARRGPAVVGPRLGRCGLTLPPAKPRLWPFWCPSQGHQRGHGPAPGDFWGCTWSGRRTRPGHWWRGCKTRRASLRRAKTSIDDWCRHRHLSSAAHHAALTRRVRGPGNSFGVSGH